MKLSGKELLFGVTLFCSPRSLNVLGTDMHFGRTATLLGNLVYCIIFDVPFSPSGLACLRISCKRVFFTPSNTGLKDSNDYPELGSVWKAAHVKVVMWFVGKKICEVAASKEVPRLR